MKNSANIFPIVTALAIAAAKIVAKGGHVVPAVALAALAGIPAKQARRVGRKNPELLAEAMGRPGQFEGLYAGGLFSF